MSFIKELRRRNVIRVGVAYAVAAWLLIEITATTFPILKLPDWSVTLVTVLVLIGFPLALILAWAFELTPEGIKKEKDVDRPESITHITGRKLDFIIIGVLAAALVMFALDKFVWTADVAPASIANAEQRSIAVLPFVNMSSDPEQIYFSDGISEEILNGLAHLPGLRVAARTSAFSFRGQNTDIRIIGEALDVDHVLEGSVRRAGNRVRITAQLIKVDDGFQLWSEEYNRDLTDIFAVQDDIAGAVVDALRVQLLRDATIVRDGYKTANVEAHDAYLLGRHRLLTRRLEDLTAARDYFQTAVELDPNYAAAHAGVAEAVNLLNYYGGIDLAEMIAIAGPAIARALELDPDMGEAYATRAWIWARRGNESASTADFARAIELSPNFSYAHLWYSAQRYDVGHIDEALDAAQKAVDLDPLSPIGNQWLGSLLAGIGETERGREYILRALEIEPLFANSHNRLALLEMAGGRMADGLRLQRTAVALDPRRALYAETVGRVYLSLGDLENAQSWFARTAILIGGSPEAQFAEQFISAVVRGENPERLVPIMEQLQYLQVRRRPDIAVRTIWFRQAMLRIEDIAAARDFYSRIWPELFTANEPVVGLHNYDAAGDVAWLLQQEGSTDSAKSLLTQSLELMRNSQSWAETLYIIETQALALLGREDEALAAMRQAVDRGWRHNWWYAESDPTLAAIRDRPEFTMMLDEIKADMAVQLEQVREMERRGELDPMPDLESTL